MPTPYCPACGSTAVIQKSSPKGRIYWYCNNCGARDFIPFEIPDAAPRDAEQNASLSAPVVEARDVQTDTTTEEGGQDAAALDAIDAAAGWPA